MHDVRTCFRAIGSLAAALVLLSGAPAVGAQTTDAQTTTVAVVATVVNNCTIRADAIALTDYDPVEVNASTDLDGEGRLTLACTRGAMPAIALGAGVNAAGAQRRLSGGSAMLTYELYVDPGRTQVWNAAATVLIPDAAISRAPREFTVYASIPGGQDVPAGSYTDTIVAVVNF